MAQPRGTGVSLAAGQGAATLYTSETCSSPVSNSYSPSGTKAGRMYFQAMARDDVLFLREVVAEDHPFVRGATCWERIAVNLQENVPARFAKVTARTLRERAFNLMEPYIKEDSRQRKAEWPGI